MPMLDEEEWAEIASLYRPGMKSLKRPYEENGTPIPMSERYAPMLARYEAMTGYRETNPNAVMHHRVSLYGPPCRNCGKPLRTPKAKLCGSCMAPRA
jgi:hypothetical protein